MNVRVSWLKPSVVRVARAALRAQSGEWEDHFTPQFHPPPAPSGFWKELSAEISEAEWPRITEHVARAERVSFVIRERGIDESIRQFAGSSHAVEVATLVAAVAQATRVKLDLLEWLFSCEVDELVAYGEFLDLLIRSGDREPERALRLYERFCDAALKKQSTARMWQERISALRDGLATFYVRCRRFEDAHQLFSSRHREDRDDLVVALSASRSFLAAGALARAIYWLGVGADRARELGRSQMEEKLRTKQAVLRRRMS